MASRTTLVAMITATVRHDFLNRFVQLGGFPLLNEWLQEYLKGKLEDSGVSNEFNKAIDDLILTLFQALDKIHVEFYALISNMPQAQ